MISANELRKKYIEFFKSKEHKEIPSTSLIPENDPTVLFTTAGMHPLVPYLMGQPHPEGDKLADVQKCIRTGDIEDVGDNRHLTFFEMLGNWSLNSYFKQESIEWSYEFLTDPKWLGLDPKRLYVTVFRGDGEIERDKESIKIWQEQFKKHGVEAKTADDDAVWSDPNIRIFALSKDDNFWEMGGETGPCGPCTEIFYDTKPEKGHEKKTFKELTNDFRFLEIWNNVFMSYNKIGAGKYEPLKQKNVDTGMGVERTIVALNGYNNVFEMELFVPVIEKIRTLKNHIGERANIEASREEKIIADHIKAAVMILADDKKITPSKTERGYVLRRLIRRAVRYGKTLGIEDNFTVKITETVIAIYKDVYEEVERNKEFIFIELEKEEKRFRKTLTKGLRQFDKIKSNKISGKDAFDLYQSYGFPIEMTIEEAAKHNIDVDIEEFNKELKKHQELSRTASAGMFKAGLADASEAAARLHTATHLLQAALREILGEHIQQRGSNITPERLRFDFSHQEKLTPEEIKQAENWVNDKIDKNLIVEREEMTLEKAKESGALGLFNSKYANKVSVYTIKDGDKIVSKEICSGPHVENTGKIGKFKIKKEESSSQGVRRIKAII